MRPEGYDILMRQHDDRPPRLGPHFPRMYGVAKMASDKLTILSGGQTGADRAALDAALEAGVPCGGWCPAGRVAEDGTIPEEYPLVELPNADYPERTRANVQDSDGTVIFYFKTPSGGTELTLKYCLNATKPYLLIDASEFATTRAADRIRDFIASHAIKRLNIAGPRASHEPAVYPYVKNAMSIALTLG